MKPDISRLSDELIAMVGVPSVNTFGHADPAAPAEENMACYFEKRLLELGLTVDSHVVEDGRRNVWGRFKGTGGGPTILLAGHLDTVGVVGYENPFDGHVKDGRVYGRGSCDMKAGLACYLEVVQLLKESSQPLSGDLIVAGIVDEEHAMIGSEYFGRHGPSADYAIVAEPSSLKISPAHKGQVCLSISTTGLSVHSSMPELGINAIYHMNALLSALQTYAHELSLRPADPMCGRPTFSVGTIKGGLNVSSVPDSCEIEIDRRTIPGESFESVMEELTQILNALAAEIPDFNYDLSEPSLNVPPLSTSVTSHLVTCMEEAVRETLGKDAELVPFPGSTDAPNLGVPAVICGAGALAQCHSLNEYVPLDEMVAAVEIYIAAIHKLQSK